MPERVIGFTGESYEKAVEKAAEFFGCEQDGFEVIRSVKVARRFSRKNTVVFVRYFEPTPELEPLKEIVEEVIEQEQLPGIDGSFTIDYTPRGVTLTVTPAIGGKEVTSAAVYAYIFTKRIQNADYESILRALESFRTEVIAPYQEKAKIDESVQFELDQYGYEAQAIFAEPDGGAKLTYGEFLRRVNDCGIYHGIPSNLKQTFENRQYGELYTIARATMPINGRDASIDYRFRRTTRIINSILHNKHVNYNKLDLINPVKSGALIAKRIPPRNGIDGMDIFGNLLRAKRGKDIKLPKGVNTVLSEDKDSLYSTIEGACHEYNSTINVTRLFVMERGVTYNSHNIYAEGNLLIKGNVSGKCTIEAEGDIEIMGVTEGVTIKARGDIMFHQGISGMKKADITAGGNIYARYIKSATVTAGKSIYTDCIMHSKIMAGDSIYVQGRNGGMFGGSARASNNIAANILGSHNYAETIIELGHNFHLIALREELSNKVKNLEERLKILRNPYDSRGKLISDKLLRHRNENDRVVKKFKADLEETVEKLREVNHHIDTMKSGSIRANTIFQNVIINICENTMQVTELMRNAEFANSNGKINIMYK